MDKNTKTGLTVIMIIGVIICLFSPWWSWLILAVIVGAVVKGAGSQSGSGENGEAEEDDFADNGAESKNDDEFADGEATGGAGDAVPVDEAVLSDLSDLEDTEPDVLERAAQGDPEAQDEVSNQYQQQGSDQCEEMAKKLCDEDESLSMPDTIEELAKENLFMLKAAYWLRKSAEQDYSNAMYYMSDWYERGEYAFAKDLKKALFWARKLAEQNGSRAYTAARICMKLSKFEEAEKWAIRQAEAGRREKDQAKGFVEIGNSFYNRKYSLENCKKAEQWYDKALEIDKKSSDVALRFYLLAEDLLKNNNPKGAERLFRRSAALGYEQAQKELFKLRHK